MEQDKHRDPEYDHPAGCFLRLFWMMIGNMILLLSVVGISRHPTGGLGLADASYWGIVACLLLARYIDIRYFRGLTADGDPATMADWRRYASVLGAVSTGLWLGAHTLAYYGAQKAIQHAT
jgi:hypothetical protein